MNMHAYLKGDGTEIVEKVFQYRRGNVWKQGFLSMFTQSHWIVYEGGLSFYNAANKLVKEIGKATTLSFKFATWGVAPSNSHENLVNKKNISVSCFKSTFYGFIICRDYLPSNKKIIDSYMKA